MTTVQWTGHNELLNSTYHLVHLVRDLIVIHWAGHLRSLYIVRRRALTTSTAVARTEVNSVKHPIVLDVHLAFANIFEPTSTRTVPGANAMYTPKYSSET